MLLFFSLSLKNVHVNMNGSLSPGAGEGFFRGMSGLMAANSLSLLPRVSGSCTI